MVVLLAAQSHPHPPARFDRKVALPRTEAMARILDQTCLAYGPSTARFVALQFEHPYAAISAW